MLAMKQMLIWEPSIYRAELDCKGCYQRISPKAIFFIDGGEIQYLLPRESSSYQAYSVRCGGCGLKDFLHDQFSNEFRQAMNYYNPDPMNPDTPLIKALRQVVREELKQILKEEAFDPNGPFSPAP